MARPPTIDSDSVRAQIMALQREPFREVLAEALGCTPSREAMAAFSEKHPDRWAQCLAILGRLSGYKDEMAVAKDSNVSISLMSDAELIEEMHRLRRQVVAAGGSAAESIARGGASGDPPATS